jgi:hypothetical protein
LQVKVHQQYQGQSGGKFATHINDTGGKFGTGTAGVVNTGGNNVSE